MASLVTLRRLTWQIGWRTTLWGLRAGSTLGAAYGALFSVGLIVNTWGHSYAIPIPSHSFAAMLMNIYTIVFFVAVGLALGGMAGAFMGLCGGLLNGIILSSITWLFFRLPYDNIMYCRTIRIASVLVTVGATMSILILVAAKPLVIDFTVMSLLYFAMPIGVAGFYAWIASQRIVRWYETFTESAHP